MTETTSDFLRQAVETLQSHDVENFLIISSMTLVKEHKLSFCTIYQRDDDIAIIKINEGVNVDAKMAREVSVTAAPASGPPRA